VFTGILLASLSLGMGLVCFTLGLPGYGGLMVLVGVLQLGLAWHFRYLLPVDPQFQADIQEWLAIRSLDVARADEMWRRIIAEAQKREAERLADLRARAAFDRSAAVELRNRLREKVYVGQGMRRWAQRTLGSTPEGPAVLNALDRETSTIRQRLLEAEQFL
jgi:hypothetical protein